MLHRENVIQVGVIRALNLITNALSHLLEPLVDKRNALWHGVSVCTHKSPCGTIHAALLCCSADIHAARKLFGFLKHQANRGCSHCYKIFLVVLAREKIIVVLMKCACYFNVKHLQYFSIDVRKSIFEAQQTHGLYSNL